MRHHTHIIDKQISVADGTLCLVDLKPRRFSSDQYSILANFAEMVVRELERDQVGGMSDH